jgi:hypothetical protein
VPGCQSAFFRAADRCLRLMCRRIPPYHWRLDVKRRLLNLKWMLSQSPADGVVRLPHKGPRIRAVTDASGAWAIAWSCIMNRIHVFLRHSGTSVVYQAKNPLIIKFIQELGAALRTQPLRLKQSFQGGASAGARLTSAEIGRCFRCSLLGPPSGVTNVQGRGINKRSLHGVRQTGSTS